jgi:hypothetical protein
MRFFSSFRGKPAKNCADEEKDADPQGIDDMEDVHEKDDVAHLLMAEQTWSDAERAGFFQGEKGLQVVSLRKSKDVYM